MEIPYIVNARKDTGLNNSKIAIWLFLASEVMLFGGLFSSYIFLRIFADYPWPERALPVLPGLINTFILIASSVTVVYAWASLKLRKWNMFVINMSFTLFCAAIFMVFKGYEYNAKFHHQAVTYNDWTVVEGHTHPEHDGHGGNFYAVNATAVTFKLNSYYKPYLEEILERIGDSEIKIAADYKITSLNDDENAFEEKLIAKEGEVVNAERLTEILAEAKEYYIGARTHNQEVRTEALRLAWKQFRANKDDKFTEFVGKSHHEPEVKEAVNALHSELVDENATGDLMLDTDSIKISLDNTLIKVNPAWGRMNGKKEGAESSVKLKDSTTIVGKAADSGMELDIDAIDFRHMVMKLREKIEEGVEDEQAITRAINASPILNIPGEQGDKIKKLWKTHQDWVRLFKKELHDEYGEDKDGNAKRVPTDVDTYRITWKQMVAYQRIEHKGLEFTLDEVKAQQPSMIEGFTGANHKVFNSKEKDENDEIIAETDCFPSITIPREEIRFESVFSPKMNNYYAIYFTITGLHGLHVIGGALVLGYYLFFGRKMYNENPEWLANRVEVGGLFWHFVDLVWIFVFPIFYLM